MAGGVILERFAATLSLLYNAADRDPEFGRLVANFGNGSAKELSDFEIVRGKGEGENTGRGSSAARRSAARDRGNFLRLSASDRIPRSISRQVTGAAIGNSGCAGRTYAETAVVWWPLRRNWMKSQAARATIRSTLRHTPGRVGLPCKIDPATLSVNARRVRHP